MDGGDEAPHALGAGGQAVAFDDDIWELYDTTKDWSQARDLSKQNPAKLHKLQRLWLIEAVKYNVLPLDDRFARARQRRDRGQASAVVRGTGG